MNKPSSLRKFLELHVKELKTNPEGLLIFVEKGRVVSTLTPALSFVYRYKLNIVVTDYNAHSDTIMLPLLIWVRENQPDLLTGDSDKGGIDFEAELLNHETADISITLDLTESVVVSRDASGKLICNHIGEPALPDTTGPTGWELTAGGEIVTQ